MRSDCTKTLDAKGADVIGRTREDSERCERHGSGRQPAIVLNHTCGILLPREVSRATEAVRLYQERNDSQEFKDKAMQFRRQYSPDVYVSADENAWRIRNVPGYEVTPAHQLQLHILFPPFHLHR